jgi:GWxTD domain-containing protein
MRFIAAGAWIGLLALGANLYAAPAKKPALPAKYSKWLNEEVVYLISDEERKDFLKLETDAQRDEFIKEFWDIRNPLRGSERNPFKEEFYKRLEYANANFGRMSNTPGWMTDMGRTYILFGKPDTRFPLKGYSQIYPLELWFYSNKTGNPSLPPFFYVLFFIPEDIGEYRFYHPLIDGPMKLVRGSQFHTNRDVYNFLKPLGGDLAQAVLSLNPSEPIDTVDFNPNMSGEMLVNKIQNFANDNYEKRRIAELRSLRARVTSWFLVNQEKPLDLVALPLADPTGQYWVDYGVLIGDPELGQASADGKSLTISAGFRLLTEAGELILEDAEERTYPAFDVTGETKTFRPFLLCNRAPLVPGKYKLEVQIVNRKASRSYKAERTIDAGDPNRLSLLGPLIAGSIQQVGRPDPITPFQYFGVQFYPGADRRFAGREALRALFQIKRPASDQSALAIDYVLAHAQDRNLRRTWTDAVAPNEFRDGRLIKAKTIPLEGFEPGDYRLVINIRAEGSTQVLASSLVPLKLDPGAPRPELFFLANFRTVASNPSLTAYFRGLEAMALKRDEAAAAYLQQAVDTGGHANPSANRALVQLYFNARKYDRIKSLYERAGMSPFQTAPETVAELALSLWSVGDRSSATRVLESGRSLFPDNTLLPALARRITASPSGNARP